MFGGQSASTGGLFNQTGSGLFGQATGAGQPGGLFSQVAATGGLFGQAGTGLFGQSTGDGQQTGTSGLSGQTAPMPFGGSFSQTASTGGLFNQTGGGLFGQTKGTSQELGAGPQAGTGASSSQAFSSAGQLGGVLGQSAGTSGLFGQTGGGLFGQTGGGLFGQTGGGLFGQATGSSQQAGASGPSSEIAGASAFSGQTTGAGQTGQTGGGLFGQSAGTSSLFGQTGGGLFGQTGGGLFGQTGGGLFGQATGSSQQAGASGSSSENAGTSSLSSQAAPSSLSGLLSQSASTGGLFNQASTGLFDQAFSGQQAGASDLPSQTAGGWNATSWQTPVGAEDEANRDAPPRASPAQSSPVRAEEPNMKMSKAEYVKVKELLQLWSDRIHTQVNQFGALASAALATDSEIVENATIVRELLIEQNKLRARQEAVDHSVNLIWEQQDAVFKLFHGLEEALELHKLPRRGVGPGLSSEVNERSKHEQREMRLHCSFDELDRMIEELSQETSSFQASRYTQSPLATAAYVLDAHSDELNSLQQRINATERKLRSIELGL